MIVGKSILFGRCSNVGTPSNVPIAKASAQDNDSNSSYPTSHAGEETRGGLNADIDVQKLVGDPLWLLNDLRRRVVVSALAPRLYFAQAGTASSGHFHTHLMEQSAADENSVTVVTDEIRACIVAGLVAEDPQWLWRNSDS
jgi:hypothetical protein